MTFGSLFSGIGGMDLGFERAGLVCRWQVEIDDYATSVLERHWPDVRRWRDIAEFIADAERCPLRKQSGRVNGSRRSEEQTQPRHNGELAVDVICGGFPCQPFSVAGRRRGVADERWLWPSFRRVIELIRPSIVVIENVQGLLSIDDGRVFGGILGDLASLGFDAEWQVLPAAAFGAPHLRKRVFVVAYTAEPRQPQSGTQAGSKGRSNTGGQRGGESVAELGNIGGNWSYSDASSPGLQERDWIRPREQEADASNASFEWGSVEPTIRRGDDGVPNRVQRLKCLGNAVVPQVAEWIGRRIKELYDG